MKKSNKELYKKLSKKDMCQLITLFANDIEIYIGMSPLNRLRSAEINEYQPCFMNGELIQINTEWAFTEKVIPFTKE